MTSYETILYQVADGVATITLNRPDKYNALTRTMYKELGDAFKNCARDAQVRAVILTGAGKGFCAGQDLTEMVGAGALPIGELLRNGLNTLITTVRSLEKPVIAAVNGAAAGAGASLALASDLRIAADNATFVFAAFVNIALVPDGGATYLLQQLVGASRALELALLADSKNRLTAEQALAWGLVNRVTSTDDLTPQAQALAAQLAKMPTRAIGMTKRAIYRAAERSLTDALEYEAQLQDVTTKTADHQEGVAAFLEKREPVFKGV
jgi:2-(1,2-epoxy-1,2-dihydrophenyl)acetyl-CoA isomerase